MGLQGVTGDYKGLQRVIDKRFSNENVPRDLFFVYLHNTKSQIFDENGLLTPFEKSKLCVIYKQKF